MDLFCKGDAIAICLPNGEPSRLAVVTNVELDIVSTFDGLTFTAEGIGRGSFLKIVPATDEHRVYLARLALVRVICAAPRSRWAAVATPDLEALAAELGVST